MLRKCNYNFHTQTDFYKNELGFSFAICALFSFKIHAQIEPNNKTIKIFWMNRNHLFSMIMMLHLKVLRLIF
jgi:hypothetical protein